MSEETSMKWASAKSWGGILVGTISAERKAKKWCFKLELYSLKLKRIEPIRRPVSEIICRDLELWIDEIVNLPEDAPKDKYKLQLEHRENRQTGALNPAALFPLDTAKVMLFLWPGSCPRINKSASVYRRNFLSQAFTSSYQYPRF